MLRCFLLLSFLACSSVPSLGQIRVGIGVADITPPIGGLTAGYSSADATTGVHDQLSARILLLESDLCKLALVSCDLCVFNPLELHKEVVALGFDRLLFCNTHTHAGPKMNQDFPSKESPWSVTISKRILAAIKAAQSSMFDGYFQASNTKIQLGYNRLIRRGDFALTYFDNPERIPYGPVDDQVGVIRITDSDGRVRGVLVNYACHPVVLGPRNVLLSADYPGVTRRLVEEDLEDDAICIFFQGGAGDINPLFLARDKTRDRDFEIVERMGESLATEVQRALSFIEDQPGKSQSLTSLSSSGPFAHRFETEQTVTLGTTTILINDEIGIVTMPGEPFHKFGKDIRELSNLKHMYLFGYCCNAAYDWPAYLPDLVSAARGGYGASENTRAEVGAGESLINKAMVQLYELQGRLKTQPMRNTFDVKPK